MTQRLLCGKILLIACFVYAPVRAESFSVGDPFPGVILPNLGSGEPSSVNDWRGQKLILHIWASW